jgi:lipopolysaccharide cholinephosphotransferase
MPPLNKWEAAAIVVASAAIMAGVMFIVVCCCMPSVRLPPADILCLYQLMKDADELFAKHGVAYVVESGTLLGAVRHGGIIPIDDDLDIQIKGADEAEFVRTLLPEFVKLGYGWKPQGFGYQIHHNPGKRQFPFLDVFVVTSDGIRTHGKEKCFDKFHFLETELYPIKRYAFGDIEVNGPRDPVGFLTRAYGGDCMDTWMPTHSHLSGLSYLGARRQKMLPADYLPAQPTGPLVNAVL